eukprot:gnl/Trimastix_PCT/2096.p1 GENE.gnl/Trimastix_PCT/2096~~gnl/Trimastix_PCT/2096.p1  ORF type:complete len:383 (+),score=92.42 gnl/Trimastix_PCT/2096:841-1989(+)
MHQTPHHTHPRSQTSHDPHSASPARAPQAQALAQAQAQAQERTLSKANERILSLKRQIQQVCRERDEFESNWSVADRELQNQRAQANAMLTQFKNRREEKSRRIQELRAEAHRLQPRSAGVNLSSSFPMPTEVIRTYERLLEQEIIDFWDDCCDHAPAGRFHPTDTSANAASIVHKALQCAQDVVKGYEELFRPARQLVKEKYHKDVFQLAHDTLFPRERALDETIRAFEQAVGPDWAAHDKLRDAAARCLDKFLIFVWQLSLQTPRCLVLERAETGCDHDPEYHATQGGRGRFCFPIAPLLLRQDSEHHPPRIEVKAYVYLLQDRPMRPPAGPPPPPPAPRAETQRAPGDERGLREGEGDPHPHPRREAPHGQEEHYYKRR